MGQEWTSQVKAVQKGPGVYSQAIEEEWGSGERQMEIMVTKMMGPAERSKEKEFREKMRYIENESRR